MHFILCIIFDIWRNILQCFFRFIWNLFKTHCTQIVAIYDMQSMTFKILHAIFSIPFIHWRHLQKGTWIFNSLYTDVRIYYIRHINLLYINCNISDAIYSMHFIHLTLWTKRDVTNLELDVDIWQKATWTRTLHALA